VRIAAQLIETDDFGTNDGMAPIHHAAKHEIIFYSTPDGTVRVEVLYEGETFWLSQKKMVELFWIGVQTINHHLQDIYKAHELNEMATIRKNRIVKTEGLREVAREVDFYNLDAIIAVGYRVNSREATQFRIWATQVLREYLIRSNTTQCRARGSRRRQRRRLKQEPPAAPPAPRPHRPFEALIEKRPQGYDPMKTMPVRKAPPAPFTTATLLQAASVTSATNPTRPPCSLKDSSSRG
jgi:hypothetical protein